MKAAVLTVSDRVSRGEARGRERRPARGAAAARTATRSSGASSRTSAREISAALRELAARVAARADDRRHRPRARATSRRRRRSTCSSARRRASREAIRADAICTRRRTRCSRAASPASIGSTLVVNLPGSPGGCRDGYAVLRPGARARARAARRRRAHARTGRRDASAAAAYSAAGAFARLVKIEHTVFALPFAYVGAFLAVGRRRRPRTTCSGSRSRWSARARSRWR